MAKKRIKKKKILEEDALLLARSIAALEATLSEKASWLPSQLSFAAFYLLFLIRTNPTTTQELCRIVGKDIEDVQLALNELSAKGYVERAKGSYSATGTGKRLLEQSLASLRVLLRTLRAQISASSVETFDSSLLQILNLGVVEE